MEQTKEEILDQVKATNKLFTSSKLNRIAGLIPDLLNQIRRIDLSSFGIDFMGQSIPKQAINSALYHRNGPSTTSVYDLLLNSKVLVRKSGNQTGPYCLLAVKDKTCCV